MKDEHELPPTFLVLLAASSDLALAQLQHEARQVNDGPLLRAVLDILSKRAKEAKR